MKTTPMFTLLGLVVLASTLSVACGEDGGSPAAPTPPQQPGGR